ncbi:hypothetical protein [Nodularia sphaerocarpa]|uniref:hypothetical protein n=1 Tax=Nodularia sphaerocarpa TaxID=137816 RepID=UPI001EFC11B4|nr:hypothetical protein [Nodularia sphaerocarpa]MDB9374875.1 hypothetical protein [Nodularia sphaerocarpa CS-585]MDB9376662.1 hypothetical protein [Nodularia sphaerocarpa CS-585A2]ULP71533.1 hypothetical protein BDGGKGIB_01160 [Nodularia sphaerocarpa UHCC 0038]
MKSDNNQQQESETEIIKSEKIEYQAPKEAPDTTEQQQQSEPEIIKSEKIEHQPPKEAPDTTEPIWIKLIKRITKVTPIIWITVVFIVIIPLLGQMFISRAFSSPTPDIVNQRLVDWSQVDEEMILALKNAHEDTRSYASDQLDIWVDEWMTQVDSSFLDWYFSYFTQKQREYKGFWLALSSGALHLVNPDNPTPEEKVAEIITESFQQEFAKRVVRPKIAQLKLERLTQQTINHYVEDLEGKVDEVKIRNKIPLADWNRYLSDIAITINDGKEIPASFSMKVLLGGSGYVAIKPLVVPLLGKIGSQMTAKLSGKIGAKIAAKTGASLTGKIGAGLLDPIFGIGIIAWDLWDYNHTVKIERPILRKNIADYLKEVKFSLLDNPVNGIMTPIEEIESKILQSI